MAKGFKFEHGFFVRSNITGFEGIITSRADHLNGCDRYWIQPRVKEDGKMPEGYWVDEGEIEVIEEELKLERSNNDRGGFPSKIK